MKNDLIKSDKEIILSFNVNDMIEIQAEISASKKTGRRICIMVTETAINFAGYNYLLSFLKEAKRDLKDKVLIQLDHGKDTGIIKKCIKDKFDIIMFDGSNLPFQENIRLTRSVVKFAHKNGVKVEGALGRVGDLFKGAKRVDSKKTDPEQARNFISKTNVDYLAVSVGNYHGNIQKKPPLDLSLIAALSKQISLPLVLHGADFIGAESLKKSIRKGIRKLNFGPELRYAYWKCLVRSMKKITSDDQREALRLARSAIQEVVQRRIEAIYRISSKPA